MKKTWIEWLHELPVDAVLREFLTAQGLAMPADFAWTDTPEATRAVIAALARDAEGSARDRVSARLRAATQLADSAGTQAMFEVATGDAAILAGLATCKSDAHRSLWLYVKHPTLFDRAGDVDHFECQSAYAHQHDLGAKQAQDTSQTALGARDEVKRYSTNPNIHSVVESSAVTVGLFYLPQSMGLPCFGSEALHPLPAGSDLTKGPSGQRCEGEKISFSGRLAFDALAMPVRPIRADTRTALWKAPPEAVLPLYRVVLVAFHYSCPRCHEKTACQGTHQL